jgi:hypothetical protein
MEAIENSELRQNLSVRCNPVSFELARREQSHLRCDDSRRR